MIVAICSAFEEPHLGEVVNHLWDQHVDRVLISTPPHDEITLRSIDPVNRNYIHQTGPFIQNEEMTRLAHYATDTYGATWIVPFDADEYWIDPLHTSIRDVLAAQPDDIGKIHCAMFKHLDYERRLTHQNPIGKVVFRPHPNMQLEWGQHGVSGVPGADAHGLLEVRELQYRDKAHWDAKIDKARRLHESGSVPAQYGDHMRDLVNMTDEERDAAWTKYQAQETVHDPIPVRRRET